MDFSDQISLGARLAEEQPDVGALERTRFRVVLLDEYQDTSVAQARMLSSLFSGPTRPGHAVTAVGDPNQAIYGWRGASVSNILNFAETFPSLDGEVPVLPLTVNRRSDRRILQVANELAGPAVRRDLAGASARAEAGGGRRVGRGARLRDPGRGARLARGRRARRPRERRQALVRHRRADPRQQHRRVGLRHAHGGRHPGRDRRPLRTAAPARGGRDRRDARAAPRRHRQRRRC